MTINIIATQDGGGRLQDAGGEAVVLAEGQQLRPRQRVKRV